MLAEVQTRLQADQETFVVALLQLTKQCGHKDPPANQQIMHCRLWMLYHRPAVLVQLLGNNLLPACQDLGRGCLSGTC
jgi:hypothetical protein